MVVVVVEEAEAAVAEEVAMVLMAMEAAAAVEEATTHTPAATVVDTTEEGRCRLYEGAELEDALLERTCKNPKPVFLHLALSCLNLNLNFFASTHLVPLAYEYSEL